MTITVYIHPAYTDQVGQHCLDALPSAVVLGAYTAPTYREALDAYFTASA